MFPTSPSNATSYHDITSGNLNATSLRNSTTGGLASIKIQTDQTSLVCDGDFFAANTKNWNASGAGQAYREWISGVDKNSHAWTNRHSEPDFFAKQVLKWPEDIECSPEEKGCNPMLDCDGILSRVRDKEQARQIFLLFAQFHNINLKPGVVKEQSVIAEVGIQSKAMDMAHTFYWLHDDNIDRKCAIEAGLTKGIIVAILVTATAVGGVLVAPAGAAVGGAAAAEGAVAGAADAAEGAVAGTAGAVEGAAAGGGAVEGAVTGGGAVEGGAAGSGTASEGASTIGGSIAVEGATSEGSAASAEGSETVTAETVEDTAAKAKDNVPWYQRSKAGNTYGKASQTLGGKAIGNILSSIPTFIIADSLDKALCKGIPNAPKEAEAMDEKMLYLVIEAAGSQYRRAMDESMYAINHGSGLGENGIFAGNGSSLLAELIFDGNYVELTPYERHIFVDYPTQVEADLKRHFTNAMISFSLKSSMCFLHCTLLVPGSYENRTLEDPAHTTIATSRFEPAPGTHCQAQCMQNFGVKHAKEVKMFGLDVLSNPDNEFGITATEFVNASFVHWQQTHYAPNEYFPTIDEVISGKAGSTTSGSYLPICYNDMPLADFTNKTNMIDRVLPCICGDAFENETAAWMHDAGISQWVDADDGRNIAETCQRSFQTQMYRPVPSFLAICELGYHYPVHGDKKIGIPKDHHHRLGDGPDYYCKEVAKLASDLTEKGMDQESVDCEVCDSETGKAIMKQQRGFVHHNGADPHWNRYNFQHACKYWCDGDAPRPHLPAFPNGVHNYDWKV